MPESEHNYEDSVKQLLEDGFTRVERDDRLFDIFPDQIREKGIELWEKPDGIKTHFVRIHEPHNIQSINHYTIPSLVIAEALLDNKPLDLEDYSNRPPD